MESFWYFWRNKTVGVDVDLAGFGTGFQFESAREW